VIRFKKFYVTTAIDYPNTKPHLGHAYEKIIADVMARWHRLKGEDVFFLTGLDEHGQKIERAAKIAGKTPQEFVNQMSVFFINLCKKLNISYDDFIRTTEDRHIKVAIEIFKKVFDKRDIYKGVYEGLYCVSCEAFYTEKDAIDGKCPLHKTDLELIKEESYFFKLGKYQNKIIEHIKNNKNFILPESRRNEILNRLKEPLKDLSISRVSFNWGIPLSIDNKHVQYVWFDALLNYISALDYPNEKFKKYWPADVQNIGKDISWFHTVIWPAILLASDIELPKTIFVHGFVNVEGEKLSKSRGITVDPIELADKYGADALRYFLIREIPLGEDGNYSEEALLNRYNSELADSLGNLINRVLVLVEKNFDGFVPRPHEKDKMEKLALNVVKAVDGSVEDFQFHNALNDIFYLVNELNKHINENKPWEIEDKEKLGGILYNLLEALRFVSILIYPFMPETAGKIMTQLGLEKEFSFDKLKWGVLKSGTKTKRDQVLFNKIKN
jgi:methionyl-tRNA synthetase